MDYETFISENMQEVTKELNDVIQSFKSKGLKISFDFINNLSEKLDLLENTDEREFFIQSFIFEKIVTDLDKINDLIASDSKDIISDDYLDRECFTSSILEGILNPEYKKSKAHNEYLSFIELNKPSLDIQVKKHVDSLLKDKKIIDEKSLNNLKEWCYESFNTPKFYTRKYIYLYFHKNQLKINLSIDPNYIHRNILDELLEVV